MDQMRMCLNVGYKVIPTTKKIEYIFSHSFSAPTDPEPVYSKWLEDEVRESFTCCSVK